MAFVVTSIECFGKQIDEPLTKRFQQWAVLSYTAANTDVALDVGNYTGTFWTATTGTATGAAALAAFKSIQTKALACTGVGGEALIARAHAAAAAAGAYSAAMNGTNTHLPDITFFATNAPTVAKIYYFFDLKNNESPVATTASV